MFSKIKHKPEKFVEMPIVEFNKLFKGILKIKSVVNERVSFYLYTIRTKDTVYKGRWVTLPMDKFYSTIDGILSEVTPVR